jgi:hypothetical protein
MIRDPWPEPVRRVLTSTQDRAFARRAFVVTVAAEAVLFLALLAGFRTSAPAIVTLFWINVVVFAAAVMAAIAVRIRNARLPGIAGVTGSTTADSEAISRVIEQEFRSDAHPVNRGTELLIACRSRRSGWTWGEWLVVSLAPNDEGMTEVTALSWNVSLGVNLGTNRRNIAKLAAVLPIRTPQLLGRADATMVADEWVTTEILTRDRTPQPSWV